MKLRWGKTESKYFSKPIKKAECTNDVMWWFLFGAVVIMEVIVIGKIVGIFQEVKNLWKEVAKMPKVKCPICGKVWYGWALKYKDCYCECGEKLEEIEE